MKIFVDNNIIIDFLVQQRANHKEAVELFRNQQKDEIFCFSYGSLSDINYILKKDYTVKDITIATFFQGLAKSPKFECLSLKDEHLGKACKYMLPQISNNKKVDLEDITQYFCALENGCKAIITNDKNFPKPDIPLVRTC